MKTRSGFIAAFVILFCPASIEGPLDGRYHLIRKTFLAKYCLTAPFTQMKHCAMWMQTDCRERPDNCRGISVTVPQYVKLD